MLQFDFFNQRLDRRVRTARGFTPLREHGNAS